MSNRLQILLQLFVFSSSAAIASLAISTSLRDVDREAQLRGSALQNYRDTEALALDWLAAHPDEPYLLFFGPSTTERMINPAVFDEAMAAQGVRVTSFNLGLRGACLHEVDYYLRRAITRIRGRGAPMPLRVVIDVSLPGVAYQLAEHPASEDNILSSRSEEWHDLVQTRAVLRSIWSAEGVDGELKRRSTMLHLRVAASRLWNRKIWRAPPVLGIGHRLLDERERRARGDADETAEASLRGFTGLGGDGIEQMREAFLESFPDGYPALIEAKIAELEAETPPLVHFNPEAMRAQKEWIGKVGLEAAYVVAPLFPSTEHVRAYHEAGLIEPLLAYDDPRAYSEFFALENRYEEYHLTNDAAEHYTRRLAQDLAALLGAGEQARQN